MSEKQLFEVFSPKSCEVAAVPTIFKTAITSNVSLVRRSSPWVTAKCKLGGRISGSKGGIICRDLPRCGWKFEKPVDAFTVFMIVNLIHSRAHTQPICCLLTWKWRGWLIILFVCSLVLSVYGWYAVDICNLTPHKVFNAFQNWDIKSLSLSDTIVKGRLFSQYQSLKKRMAKSSAAISIHVGRNQMSAPKRSVMDKMQLKPESSFQGLMKFIMMDWPWVSGIGNGCKGLGVFVVLDLFLWHSSHTLFPNPASCLANSKSHARWNMLCQPQNDPRCDTQDETNFHEYLPL